MFAPRWNNEKIGRTKIKNVPHARSIPIATSHPIRNDHIPKLTAAESVIIPCRVNFSSSGLFNPTPNLQRKDTGAITKSQDKDGRRELNALASFQSVSKSLASNLPFS